ncbi:MAG: 50S ribosomal protein L3 N(5)-glutamine methyltransferase, partial [Xanthomonadales bacterium]|nr:50S ribosomal protein L3 N(5)-glutamine methyltransferase [Xanthomonadales bacterium]NIX12221.1 50S ribosomal protein L3 N(5)-glutamine methyltransferase [Xanthomonadales bacterium]
MNFAEQIEECAEALNRAGVHFGHGTDNARDEAAWLVLHAAGLPCDGSFGDWSRSVPADCRERISRLLGRRIGERKPLAYLIGESWFCGLRFVI